MHVLITHTDFDDPGGITSYFKKLRGRFSVDVTNFITGRRPDERGQWARLRRFITDNRRFAALLDAGDIDLVHLNLSLGWLAMPREALFLRSARRRRIPVVVFFRGWVPGRAAFIERRCLWLFRGMFKNATAFIVLADAIQAALRRWGFTQPIHREVTVIDDGVLEDIDLEACTARREAAEKWQVLFLARVLKTKGIYEALDAAALLQEEYPKIELVVAGDGPELAGAKSHAKATGLGNVRFLGYVSGDEKDAALATARVFFLPSYSEGFPNALVEAMAYGLPSVIRSVGGVADFFENEVHGFITESFLPEHFARHIARLYEDQDLYGAISENNARYARAHFAASSAAQRLEEIYRNCLGA